MSTTIHAPAAAETTGLKRASLRALVGSSDVRLAAGPKLALIAIARCHDDRTGRSTCSLKTIAVMAGVGEKQAARNVETLVALGLVHRTPRLGRATAYVIDLVALAAFETCRRDAEAPVDNPAPTLDICDANPGHLPPPPPTFAPPTPDTHVPRTEGVLLGTGGGTEARAGQAPGPETFPPLAEDLKTEGQDIASETLVAVNAKRARNGKQPLQCADLIELGRQATLAGLTPQAAAELILAKPSWNFFQAGWLTSKPADPAAPAPLDEAARAQARARADQVQADLLRRSIEAMHAPVLVSRPSAAVATAGAAGQYPGAAPAVAARTATLRTTPVAIGAATGTGWARDAVARFIGGQNVARATITSAAGALGLPLADLKAQRAAHLAAVAA